MAMHFEYEPFKIGAILTHSHMNIAQKIRICFWTTVLAGWDGLRCPDGRSATASPERHGSGGVVARSLCAGARGAVLMFGGKWKPVSVGFY